MASLIPFRHGNYLVIMPFSAADITADGEVTIARMDFRVPGDTRTFTSTGIGKDGDGAWIFGGSLGGTFDVYPVSRGHKVFITSIVFGAHDVNFPRVNCWLEHEEPTDGRYGHGVHWTIRRGTGDGSTAAPISAPYTAMRYPWGDGYGQHDALLGGALSGDAVWTWEPTNRCYLEFGTDQYMTVSMRRKSDPRATGALYGGGGTKLFPITNLTVLEYTLVVHGVIVEGSLDLSTMPRRERFHSELKRYQMAGPPA